MRSLPKEILDQLPLPPGFDLLPKDLFGKAKAIFTNSTLSYDQKTIEIALFIKSLSEENRALIRPELADSLKVLSKEVY